MAGKDGASVVDAAFAGVEWTAIDWKGKEPTDSAYATHTGVLMIGDFAMKVFQLDTGQRIIDADDLDRFFTDGLETE